LIASEGGRAAVKSAVEVGRDNMSSASSNRGVGIVGWSEHEEQLQQKLHSSVALQKQRAPEALRMGILANDDAKSAVGSSADISSISTAKVPILASSTAGVSNKVVSWLQASEAAFAEERAMFMQDAADTSPAVSAGAHDDGVNSVVPDLLVEPHAPRRNAGNGSSSTSSFPTLSACQIDFERIEMAGSGSLTQPVLLAALRASGTGSMKQVSPVQLELLQQSQTRFAASG
jgi:hypothetical protein